MSLFCIVSDRLGELERDKARLTEQLVAQQREHLAKEIDYYKKSGKSKNLLKKGFKKLKGKIQVSQKDTHTCIAIHVHVWASLYCYLICLS
jgi:hypothetical protein